MSDLTQLKGLTEEEKRFIKQQLHEKGFELNKYVQILLRRGIKEERIEYAIHKYINRKISISGAAKLANVSLYEFLEVLKLHGYVSNYDIDDFQKGIKLLHKN